ncbi:hypothetical protein [Nocardia australiensis]|uniref:hypothetical protein n=1 Tax=Nocardia australiensis TaxID=2887191 RepID=UPI001D133514|nr:hypothetical protein [Nocardia australiensis]
MASKRPVNRVTPRNRSATDRAVSGAGSAKRPTTAAVEQVTPNRRPTGNSRPAQARPAARRPRVAGGTGTVDLVKSESPVRSVPARRRPLGRGWWTVIACVVATVLLAGFAVLAAFRPGVDDSNQAFVNTKATEEVSAAAEHALRTVFAYDVTKLDGYKDSVRQVLTGQMLTDFDKYADTNIDAIKQAQTSANVDAKPIGVTLLTSERAELLVNMVVSASKDGVAQESASGPVVLRMEKKDDHWLASDIVDRN